MSTSDGESEHREICDGCRCNECMLRRWQSIGERLWPTVRLWPMTGVCGRAELELLEDLRFVLDSGGEAVAQDVAALEADVCARLAESLKESGLIRRVAPDARNELLDHVRSFGRR